MILCPHEIVAVHMAAGYALATGRAQAVFVHVDAGTANACMAIQNLFRYRLPVMLFAGRAPYTLHGELPGSRDTYVHFVQDPFDIASIVRPYVKWEYSLPSGIVVKEALARAAAFAHSDPPGPVYMMLPRETLAEQWDDADMPAYPPARYGSVQAGGIEPERVDAIAEALMAAENPIALTAYLGRKAEAVAVLERLARTCGIRVAEFNSIDLNISQASPCFAGFDPLPLLETGRSRLTVGFRCAVHPAICQARRRHQMDPDRYRSPEVGFSDVGISDRHANPGRLHDRAAAGARSRGGARRRCLAPRVAERIAGWGGAREAAAKRRATASANKGVSGALSPAFVFATLNEKLSQDDVVVNEAIRNATDPAGAHHAHETTELCRPRRWRPRILRRHGAGVEAGAAGSPHRAGDRRRRISFLLARQRLRGGAAVPDSDPDGRA